MEPLNFKGKRIDNGEWVYGNLIAVSKRLEIVKELTTGIQVVENGVFKAVYQVLPESVGQFTGITDRNKLNIYQGNILKIDKSNLSQSFKYSKAGETMIEKELDAYIIFIGKGDFLNITIKTYLQKDGKLLTKNDYWGEDAGDTGLFYEVGIDIRFLKYIEGFCEIIGNIHDNPELLS